jgi:hypothetical protein
VCLVRGVLSLCPRHRSPTWLIPTRPPRHLMSPHRAIPRLSQFCTTLWRHADAQYRQEEEEGERRLGRARHIHQRTQQSLQQEGECNDMLGPLCCGPVSGPAGFATWNQIFAHTMYSCLWRCHERSVDCAIFRQIHKRVSYLVTSPRRRTAIQNES